MTGPDILQINKTLAEIASQLKEFKGRGSQLIDQWSAEISRVTTPMSDSSRAAAKELQVWNRPLRLQTAVIYNAGASLRFVQFHNAINGVKEGSTADLILPVPAQTTESLDFDSGPYFSNGLYICGSSTDATKTLITTADLIIFCTFLKA